MIGIYMYTNRLDGKRYIGKSTDIEARRQKHLRNARDGRHSYFYNALRKFGPDQFEFTVLEECSEEQLDAREKFYIEQYNSLMPNGYNMTEGGTGGDYYKNRSDEENLKTNERKRASHIGIKDSEETRRRKSEAQKGKPRLYARGRPAWNRGKSYHKKKPEKSSGKDNPMFGRKQSDLNRFVNSQIHKGQIPANKGKHLVWDEDHKHFHYE